MREKYVFIIPALEPASLFGLAFITLTANDLIIPPLNYRWGSESLDSDFLPVSSRPPSSFVISCFLLGRWWVGARRSPVPESLDLRQHLHSRGGRTTQRVAVRRWSWQCVNCLFSNVWQHGGAIKDLIQRKAHDECEMSGRTRHDSHLVLRAPAARGFCWATLRSHV